MPPESPATRSKSKRVSANHTLERVRNNQRQHRARRRAYITTLEQELDEAQQTVSALRDQVEALQAELMRSLYRNGAECRALAPQRSLAYCDTSPSSMAGTHGTAFRVPGLLPDMVDLCAMRPATSSPTNVPVSGNLPLGLSLGHGPISQLDAAIPAPVDDAEVSQTILSLFQSLESVPGPPLAVGPVSTSSSRYAPELTLAPPTSYQVVAGTEILLPGTTTPNQLLAPTKPCFSCSYSSISQQTIDEPDQMAPSLSHEKPLLLPDSVFQSALEAYFIASVEGESTMLCSEAYLLIAQQNFKGISQGDVASWLWNGFRKSLQPGWGCRVKTDLLFNLLAFINDV